MRKKIIFFLALFTMFLIVFKAMPDGSTGGAPIYTQQVMGSNDIGSTSDGNTGSVSESYPMGQVSLVYSGDTWSISGYSAIMRSTKDGIPTYSNNGTERIYLGGEELHLVSAVTGVDGYYEYRTEKESFKRVIYYLPTYTTDPDTWVVYNPDGSKEYYKQKMNSGDTTPTRGWLLTQVISRGGYDSTKYYYKRVFDSSGVSTGEYLLKRIVSGNVGMPADKMTYIEYCKIGPAQGMTVDYRYGAKVESKFLPQIVYAFSGTSSVTYSWMPKDSLTTPATYPYQYDSGAGLKNYNLTGMYSVAWTWGPAGEKQVIQVTPYGSNASFGSMTRDPVDDAVSGLTNPAGATLNPTRYDYYPYNMAFDSTYEVDPVSVFGTNDPGALFGPDTSMIDIDGDGLIDIVKKVSGSNTLQVWYNRYNKNGDGKMAFDYGAITMAPAMTIDGISFPADTRALCEQAGIYDWNNDGIPDRVIVYDTGTVSAPKKTLIAYLGKPSGGFDFTNPVVYDNWQDFSLMSSSGAGLLKTPLDMDGDGEPDQLSYTGDGTSGTLTVWHKKNASGIPYATPTPYTNYGGGFIRQYAMNTQRNEFEDTRADLIDINGDGLPDRVVKDSGSSVLNVQYNKGYGFENSVSIATDSNADTLYLTNEDDTYMYQTTYDYIDMNGDGLLDRVQKLAGTGQAAKVWFNTGKSFKYGGIMTSPTDDVYSLVQQTTDGPSTRHTFAAYIDMNGDGLPDRVEKTATGPFKIAYNRISQNGSYAGKLKTVYGPNGGTITYTYQPIDKLQNKGCKPNMWVIKDKTAWDGITGTTKLKTSYIFTGGVYVYVEQDTTSPLCGEKVREYRGFGYERETAPTMDYTETNYNTNDHYLAGTKSEEKVFNKDNKPFTDSTISYDRKTLNSNSKVEYVFPTTTFSSIYDGNSTPSKYTKATNSIMLFGGGGQYGLTDFITSEDSINYGEVDLNGNDTGYDYAETITTLNNDPANWVIGYEDTKEVWGYEGSSGSPVLQGKTETYYYDNGETQSPFSTIPVYGHLAKQTKTWDGSNYVNPTTYNYDAYGNAIAVTDPLGNATTTTYDTTYQAYPLTVTKTDNYSGSTITFTAENQYDQFMRIIKKINHEMKVGASGSSADVFSATSYDWFGRPITLWGPLLSGTSTSNANAREIITYANANLNPDNTGTIVMCANTVNEKVMDLYPYGGTTPTAPSFPNWMQWTKTSIDGLGRTVMVKANGYGNSLYKAIRTYYSIYGNTTIVQTTVPFGITSTGDDFVTEPSGTLYSMTQSWLDSTYGHVNRKYNPDQQASLTNNFVTTKSKLWTTTVTDELGNTTTSVSDGLGRAASVTDAAGIRTDYYYKSGTGQLLQINAAANVSSKINTTSFVYNLLGQKTDTYDPDMGHSHFTYDVDSNLKTQTDANSNVTTFTYDNLNRLRSASTTNGSNTDSISYWFDKTYSSSGPDAGYAKGKPTYVATFTNGTRIDDKYFTYDIEQRMISEQHNILDYATGTTYKTATQSYTYNEGGQVKTMTYPDGEVIANDYDSMSGLVTCMRKSDWSYTYVNNFSYLMPFGKIGSMQYGNGVTSSYQYYDVGTLPGEDQAPDPAGVNRNYRLKTVTFNKSGGFNHYQTYTYDLTGNVLSIIDKNSYNQYFMYDNLNRMTSANGPYVFGGLDSEYLYDELGNMIIKKGITFSYGGSGQPVHGITSDGTNGNTYTYDANGNMITKTNSDSSKTRVYYYNGNNMLSTVNNNSGALVFSAIYSGEDRVRLTDSSTNSTTYFFFPQYEVKVVGTSAPILVKYYFLNGNRIAERKSNNTANMTYYHKDVLGSTIKLTDANGIWQNGTYYEPYGKDYYPTGAPVSPYIPDYLFNDKEKSDNIYYYGARYYNPKEGRTISNEKEKD